MVEKFKFCRDCKYMNTVDYGQCLHDLALKSVDIVTGAEYRRTPFQMRKEITLCGKEGLLFEKRPKSWFQRLFEGKDKNDVL